MSHWISLYPRIYPHHIPIGGWVNLHQLPLMSMNLRWDDLKIRFRLRGLWGAVRLKFSRAHQPPKRLRNIEFLWIFSSVWPACRIPELCTPTGARFHKVKLTKWSKKTTKKMTKKMTVNSVESWKSSKLLDVDVLALLRVSPWRRLARCRNGCRNGVFHHSKWVITLVGTWC